MCRHCHGSGRQYAGLSMQEAAFDAVLRFMEADMSGENVFFVAASEQEGQFYVVYGEDGSYEVRLLERISVDEVPPRKIVTIGALSNLNLGETSELENAIVQFNRSNQQYYVTMKWYEASESTISKLDIDLVSDKVPDLLCLPNLDIENLAKKGALEDLTPYVEGSDSIHLEDFIDPVLEAYRMDGVLTCLPTGFSIGTIIGRGSQVGEESGWTMEEVMRLTEKYPEKKLFVGDYLLFDFCANYYLERFIDWESGSSSFDSDEFRILAEWMKGQLTGDRIAVFEQIESVPQEYLLDSASIGPFWTMQVEKARMEEVTFIGYPTVDGRPYHVSNWPHGQIGMLSHAKEKEGAWEFLEYYISLGKKYTSYNVTFAVGTGIPTQKEALKQYIENIEKERLAVLKNEYRLVGPEDDEGRTFWQYSSMDGEKIPIYYPNEEDLEEYLELIEGIHFKPWSSGMDDEIQRIVEEELEYYFQGDKNLEEVTDIIDNKVNLMLSERK